MSKTYFYFKQILFYMVLIVYVFILAKLLLFKVSSPFELFSSVRTVTRSVNLIPFKTIFEYVFKTDFNLWIFLMEIVGNIVLFVPLGMYLQVFKKNKKILNCTILVCFISISVEVV